MFKAFGNVELQAVGTQEIPGRAGYRNAQLAIGRPNIATTPRRLKADRTKCLAGSNQRIRSILRRLFSMLSTDGEGKRAGRQIPDIPVHFTILQGQAGKPTVDGCHKNLVQNGGVCSAINTTAVQISTERIECRLGISREERGPERVIVNNAAKRLTSII